MLAQGGIEKGVIQRNIASLGKVIDAPPSGGGGTDSTRSDSDGAGVLHVPGGNSCETSVMQSLAQSVKSHTDMVAAQTIAMSALTLPRMLRFSGEGIQTGEDGFDHWLERFEKRAKLVGWSEEHRSTSCPFYGIRIPIRRTAYYLIVSRLVTGDSGVIGKEVQASRH